MLRFFESIIAFQQSQKIATPILTFVTILKNSTLFQLTKKMLRFDCSIGIFAANIFDIR